MDFTIYMACSINGFIATEDGNEDFLFYRNYEVMLDLLKEYNALIWGRKTFENVISWGENYLDDLKNTNVIVLSKNKEKLLDLPNVYYCDSFDSCIKLCEQKQFNKLLISGGATINNLFMEKKVVTKIILNYNPYVLNKGISLFNGSYFENKLQLLNIVEEKDGIVQIHYKVEQ